MNRASARSKSLTSTPRRRLATCSTACATASASRRLTPGHEVAQRGLLHRVEPAGGAEVDEREPTVGAAASRCPGCGSAWNTPSCSICSRKVRSSESASFTRSAMRAVAPVDLAHARAVEPLHHEHPRRARGPRRRTGTRMRDPSAGMVDAIVSRVARLDPEVELLAERGPRTRRPGRRRGTRAPRRARLDHVAELLEHREVDARPTRRSRAVAPSRRPANRRAAGRGTPGRSTPRRAAASRSSGTRRRAARRAPPRAARRWRRGGAGRTWSWSSDELGGGVGRDEVGAGRQHLPELHEHPAALLERQAQAPDRRAAAAGLDIVLAPEAERRPEPVAHRDARDLGVALHPAPAAAERPDRVRHRLQARSAPRATMPGPGEELDPHRGRHRAEQREQEEVAAEAVRRGCGARPRSAARRPRR